MEREELIKLRNILTTSEGRLFITYLSDYVTKQACCLREASEIKGMCELIQQIKDIPKKVEIKKE